MNPEMFSEYYRCLYRFVRAASEVQMASGDQRLSFRQARETIRAATAGDRKLIQHEWALRRRYHGRLARLAWDRRRPLLAAWHWLQTGNQLSEAH